MYVCAAPLTSAQLVHPSCLDSFSTVLLHMVLGRLRFVIGYPRDFHVNYARFNGFLRNFLQFSKLT